MRMEWIEGYQKGKLKVFNLAAFTERDRCMLLRPETGTVLGIESKLLESLKDRNISEELAFVMVQRGLASFDKSREISDFCEGIKPEFFLIDLTKKCNLECRYCFREFEDDYPEMTMEMTDKICDSLLAYWEKNSGLRLCIQAWGGEPLLGLPLILHIRERFDEAGRNPEIVMETNATLITEETAKELFRHRIDLGISIDGMETVHDLQRPFCGGQGSFKKVVQGIQNLRRAGYEGFGTITVVTKNTIKHLPEIIDCFADMSLRSVKFNMMRKNSRNMGLAPEPDEFEAYVEKLISCLHGLYKKQIPFMEQNVAQRMQNLMYRPNNNICNAYGCHGGYRMLSIDSQGKVFPCELTDYQDYCIGNIEETDYKEMVSRAISEKREYFTVREFGECRACPWQYYCRGGCRAAVKYSTGNPAGIDETECAFNKALYPKLIAILLRSPEFAEYLMTGVVER